MTQEQYDVLLTKVNAILKAVAPRTGEMGLVGKQEPPAVTSPLPEMVIANPAKYENTQWDPIKKDFRISSSSVIANFETPSKAGDFVGGTLQDWARIDFPGCWRFIQHHHPGLDVSRLSASQRSFLGL